MLGDWMWGVAATLHQDQTEGPYRWWNASRTPSGNMSKCSRLSPCFKNVWTEGTMTSLWCDVHSDSDPLMISVLLWNWLTSGERFGWDWLLLQSKLFDATVNAVWPESWRAGRKRFSSARDAFGPKVFQNAVVKLADVYGVGALVEEVNKESVEYVQICPILFSHKWQSQVIYYAFWIFSNLP